ncbi:type II toxin-antitoxin system VapC family toxin [Anatilimnocola floriformis]|uniref:type II toxin-antitoxin system VapC family toxin n=1 Tax=Anatilimnocola floriformis TaxID=2948575 RepID=UPI0036F378C9
MIYLPDTNVCVAFLRRRSLKLIGRWQATPAQNIVLSSVIVYELRYGAERSADPAREHAKLDKFLAPYASLPFDDLTGQHCATIRCQLERSGQVIGPHDLQIAATALQHQLILVTHNGQEFRRVPGLTCEDWEP